MSLEFISAVLTPAVMINVCALLLISTTNRNSRIRDRIRDINKYLINNDNIDGDLLNNYKKQLKLFRKRGLLIKNAMSLNYIAFFSFVITSILLFMNKLFNFSIIFSVIFLVFGLICLFGYAALLIKEGKINFETASLEVAKAENEIKNFEDIE